MTLWRERNTIRLLHLVLSIPVVGYIYGPVEHIARAAFFVRWIAFPLVIFSGFWMWLKPRSVGLLADRRSKEPSLSESHLLIDSLPQPCS
jgi:hypothetical protein